LDWHAAQDHAALLAHNRALTGRIFAIADDLGLEALTPREAGRRGGSVMLVLPSGLPAADAVDRLRQRGVTADHRGQTLRLSPGVMTSVAGCECLAEALADVVQGR
jgi:selenocysteine lyase/cysteine desulfurase